MAKTKLHPPHSAESTTLASALATSSLPLGVPSGGGREALETARAIGQQVYSNRLRQTATAIQTDHAERLVNTVTLRTVQYYDDFLQAEMAVRDKPRDARTQAELEAFCRLLRPQQVKSLYAIRNAAVDEIERTATEPVYAPTTNGHDRDIVITEEPNGIAKALGARTKITRIPR